MFWNLVLAAIAAFTQAVTGWMGYKGAGPNLTHKERRWRDGRFLIATAVGIAAVVGIAYRSNRTERAHFATNITNSYKPAFVVPGRDLEFNVIYQNVGSGTAFHTIVFAGSFLAPEPYLPRRNTQLEEINAFRKYRAEHHPASTIMVKGKAQFVTAYGQTVSQADCDDIMSGRQTLFVIGDVTFVDDFGHHVQHFCQMLEPPQSEGNAEIWASCNSFNDEK